MFLMLTFKAFTRLHGGRIMMGVQISNFYDFRVDIMRMVQVCYGTLTCGKHTGLICRPIRQGATPASILQQADPSCQPSEALDQPE